MPLYKKCPDCGANLDPGEKCDCANANDSFYVETDQCNASQRNPTQIGNQCVWKEGDNAHGQVIDNS